MYCSSKTIQDSEYQTNSSPSQALVTPSTGNFQRGINRSKIGPRKSKGELVCGWNRSQQFHKKQSGKETPAFSICCSDIKLNGCVCIAARKGFCRAREASKLSCGLQIIAIIRWCVPNKTIFLKFFLRVFLYTCFFFVNYSTYLLL